MSFTLTMSTSVIVGRSALENRDSARRVAGGEFRPGLGYELAQPVFELYETAKGDTAALDRYRRARDALQLRLTDPTGALVSFRELHITRGEEGGPGGTKYVIQIESDDPLLWNAWLRS